MKASVSEVMSQARNLSALCSYMLKIANFLLRYLIVYWRSKQVLLEAVACLRWVLAVTIVLFVNSVVIPASLNVQLSWTLPPGIARIICGSLMSWTATVATADKQTHTLCINTELDQYNESPAIAHKTTLHGDARIDYINNQYSDCLCNPSTAVVDAYGRPLVS